MSDTMGAPRRSRLHPEQVGWTGRRMSSVYRTGRVADARPVWTPEQQNNLAMARDLPFGGTLGGAMGLVSEAEAGARGAAAAYDVPFFGQSDREHARLNPGHERLQILSTINQGRTTTGDLVRALRPVIADPDQLAQLQLELVEIGYLKQAPMEWGILDAETMTALDDLSASRFSNLDRPWQEFLEGELSYADGERNRAFEQELAEAQGLDLDELERMKEEIESMNVDNVLTNSSAAREMIQNLSKSLTGVEMDQGKVDELIGQLHRRETEEFKARNPALKRYQSLTEAYAKKVEEIEGKQGQDPTVPNTDLDAFTEAIKRRESGGNSTAVNPDSGAYGLFQFMPQYWAGYARQAGVEPVWPPDAATQEKVARFHFARLYRQYGNWRDVAVAWYGGPGAVKNKAGQGRSQGKYPSHTRYADLVIDTMAQVKAGIGSEAYAAGRLGRSPDAVEGNIRSRRTQLGTGPGAPVTYQEVPGFGMSTDDPMQSRQRELLSTSFSAEMPGETYEAFDEAQYLEDLAREEGGADVGAYTYMRNYAEFARLLGGA